MPTPDSPGSRRRPLAGLLVIYLLLFAFSACNSGGGGGGGDADPDPCATTGCDPEPDPEPDPDPDPCAGQSPDVCDADGDGRVDAQDVCRLVADAFQCDSDADGYGNSCDCDFDQDGVCGPSDDTFLDAELGLAGFAATDMDCDADVDADDEALYDAARSEGAPGPSGLACAGSVPCPDLGLVFPGTSWATDSPSARGVDPIALQDALDYLASVSGNEGVSEAMVIVDGYSIWEGSEVDQVHNTWSVTKSFTSTAMGLLLGDGLAGFDTLAADHVSSLAASYPTVTLRHFVTHASGYDAVGGAGSSTPFDPAAPVFTPPGGRFLYWDAAINQFANVLTQIGGESLETLLEREVADPIGMPPGEWDWRDFGSQQGLVVNGGGGNRSRGIYTNARTLARFCHLFLARGQWDGVQRVPSEWIALAARTQVPYTFPNDGDGIGPGVYGYGWFANGLVDATDRLWPDAPPDTYMAAGFNQNRCWVVPEWNAVIVRTGISGGGYALAEENEFLRLMGLAFE